MLYLEGVIRTESFPFRAASLSYTPEEIARIVAMAQAAGLEVIPCISTLGHAEHFVECPELQHLREDGPWDTPMFCCSPEGTYDFLERYLHEVAPLFPGRHFHIGGDEAWNLGACPACKRRIENGATREDLLVGHIKRLHGILERLGKRVWIWDDLFENDLTGTKLGQLPRDIVLCTWHYHPEAIDESGFQGHFNNLQRLVALSLYNTLGFDVVVCPCYRGVENTVVLTEVAREHRVLGGLQTLWVMGECFLPAALPSIAFAGALWAAPWRDMETVLAETLERLFPTVSAEARPSIRAALVELYWTLGGLQEFLRGRMTLEEKRNLHYFTFLENVLHNELESERERLPSGLEREMLEELQLRCRLQIIAARLRKNLSPLVDPRLTMIDRPALIREIEASKTDLENIAVHRRCQWNQFRAGIEPVQVSKRLDALANELAAFLAGLSETPGESQALLILNLFVWDAHGLPRLKAEIATGSGWRELCRGCFKPVNLRDLAYSFQIPIDWKKTDGNRLRLTVSGHGGQGISHVSIVFRNHTLVPVALSHAKGTVSNAPAILRDDSPVCFLGSPNLVETLIRFREADETCVEVLLGSTD